MEGRGYSSPNFLDPGCSLDELYRPRMKTRLTFFFAGTNLIPFTPLAAFRQLLLALLLAGIPAPSSGTEPARRVLPPGIEIGAPDRAELESGVAELGRRIDGLRDRLKDNPPLLALVPDVIIFHKAVRWPLLYDEFLRTNDVASAKSLIRAGLERAELLAGGSAPWTNATGLVVRGYVSKVDGSVQPYGLVVPTSFRVPTANSHRLDIWLHGRDNHLTELKFLNDRLGSAGPFTSSDTFVLHPYGRYCNAFKFIGEVDVLEAMDHVREHYPIDDRRIAVRGFSMGGAGCWHLATHYAGLWVGAAPGAGFAETAAYQGIFSRGGVPPLYEQTLWHWYDATDYAGNLFNTSTVAYSGEIDKQKQAADIMADALAEEGLTLTHIIGPNTAHKYHPDAKKEVERRMDQIAKAGRDPMPRKIRFTTWTLRYSRMHWLSVEGLGKHWQRARVNAEIVGDHTIRTETSNVSELRFSMASGSCPLDPSIRPVIVLDGQTLEGPPVGSDRSWNVRLRQTDGIWSTIPVGEHSPSPRKRPGMQGPIDDAFLDSFIMVTPTREANSPRVGRWASEEAQRAIDHWRRQFRGEVRVKADVDVTEEDMARNHLVLWGDPGSNTLLAKVAERLPIRWNTNGAHTGSAIYPADRYVPVMICPNPLNPEHYVVVNSGVTFSEFGHLSNAAQTPKLPDYAILDLDFPENSPFSGKVVEAGFFGEDWKMGPHGGDPAFYKPR